MDGVLPESKNVKVAIVPANGVTNLKTGKIVKILTALNFAKLISNVYSVVKKLYLMLSWINGVVTAKTNAQNMLPALHLNSDGNHSQARRGVLENQSKVVTVLVLSLTVSLWYPDFKCEKCVCVLWNQQIYGG